MIPVEHREASHWVLDKKVPIAIIGALLCQTAALIIWITAWGTAISGRIDHLEAFATETKLANAQGANDERNRGDRLIRVETLMESIQQSVVNIERKVDQMTPVRPRN